MDTTTEDDWLATPFDLKGKSVWVTGHKGMVGGALVRRLEREGCTILTVSRDKLDLRDQFSTHQWMKKHKPEMVIIAAAKVGGILANDTYPADFLYDNLMIESNIIHAAHKCGVEKLLFLGSSCIYPKESENPISEDVLLTGKLEPTNEAYAIAKIAGIKLCQAYRKQHGRDFISAMPCNLYGPGDTFDEQNSHVIPALMMRADKAKRQNEESLSIWGSGEPRREFLYVDDLADALVFMLKNYGGTSHLNIGAGQDISIAELAGLVANCVGYEGDLVFDASKPDGTMRKLMDSSRITQAGWSPQVLLPDGLSRSYAWYKQHNAAGKALAA